ncbi:hypothetical protein CANINC_004497 [Pichia inconspicua]|uniref:Ndc10 domain-containing protein n=1 Tax=Pichia inconspicua TaxID=52247 RepID=A0A4V4NF43_9ASCO|nr:hypothetical protein CANINC_004497 [[Candida] inconspicua]
MSIPLRKKRKVEPKRYSSNSKINVIDYLDGNYPQFKDIKDMFHNTARSNDMNYTQSMFKKIAVKDPSIILKMFRFLQQYKKFIYTFDPTYDPEKHTSVRYIMRFLEHFGIEKYLANSNITKPKKLESLDSINDCFSFLYQFVHNRSITEDILFDEYRTQRLRYLEILSSGRKESTRGVTQNSADTQHNSVDTIPVQSNNDNNTNDDKAKAQNENGTLPRFHSYSSVPITAHFDLDVPDSPPESPPLAQLEPLKELSFAEYRLIMDTLNESIFANDDTVDSLARSKIIDHKLELMLGFSCCSTTSTTLKIEISELTPVTFEFNSGLEIAFSDNQSSSIILRHLEPEYCPVLMSCLQIFIMMMFTGFESLKLIGLSYHGIIRRRSETLKKANISSVSSVTTMMNVGKNFCKERGMPQSVMDNFEKHIANKESNIAVAKLMSGLHSNKQPTLRRAKLLAPTFVVRKFLDVIPNFSRIQQDSSLKTLVDYTIVVLLQDLPYIFKKYPLCPFKKYPPFNSLEFETYMEKFDYTIYDNDKPIGIVNQGDSQIGVNTNSSNIANFPNSNVTIPEYSQPISNQPTANSITMQNSSSFRNNSSTSVNMTRQPTYPELFNEYTTINLREKYRMNTTQFNNGAKETEQPGAGQQIQSYGPRQEVNNNLDTTNVALKNIMDRQEELSSIINKQLSSFITKDDFLSTIRQLLSGIYKRDKIFVNELKSLKSTVMSLGNIVSSLQTKENEKEEEREKDLKNSTLCQLQDYRKIQKSDKNYWAALEHDLQELDNASRSLRYNSHTVSPSSKISHVASPPVSIANDKRDSSFSNTSPVQRNDKKSSKNSFKFVPYVSPSTNSSALSTETHKNHNSIDIDNQQFYDSAFKCTTNHGLQPFSPPTVPTQDAYSVGNLATADIHFTQFVPTHNSSTNVCWPSFPNANVKIKPNANQFLKFINDWFYGSPDTFFHKIKTLEKSLIQRIPGEVAQFYYRNYEKLMYTANVFEISFSFEKPYNEAFNIAFPSINAAAENVSDVPSKIWETPMSIGTYILQGFEGDLKSTIETRLVHISRILTNMKNRLLLDKDIYFVNGGINQHNQR